MSRLSVGESSGLMGAIVFGLFFILRIYLRVSGPDGSEYVRMMEEMNAQYQQSIDTTQAMSEQLALVQDSDSALTAITDLQTAFEECEKSRDSIELDFSEASLSDLMHMSETNARKIEDLVSISSRLFDDLNKQTKKVTAEIERIEAMPDVPVEFWDALRATMARYMADVLEEEFEYSEDGDFLESPNVMIYDSLASRIEEHGSQRVVLVRLSEVSQQDFKRLSDDLGAIEDGEANLETWYDSNKNQGTLILAPTEEFSTYLETLPRNETELSQESRRTISLVVKDIPEKQQLVPKQAKVEFVGATVSGNATSLSEVPGGPVLNDEAAALIKSAFDKISSGFLSVLGSGQQTNQPFSPKQPIEQQIEESEQDYYKRLATLLLDNDQLLKNQAIEKLLIVDPSQISDKKTRIQIARNFRQLAGETQRQSIQGQVIQGQVIQGLAKYGGKFCVPILLDLFAEGKITDHQKLYAVLVQFPNAESAKVLVDRYFQSNQDETIKQHLYQMGEFAEPALLEVARSDDKQIVMAVLDLLGEIGTKKSFFLLNKTKNSEDEELKELAKETAIMIRKRINSKRLAATGS